MTHLVEDVTRRLRAVWLVVLRTVAAGVFGLAIAATVAVFVVGPETREEWRALPGRVASGEIQVPVLASIFARDGSHAPVVADDLGERAAPAASRSATRSPSLGLPENPFVVSGVPYVAAPSSPDAVPPAPVEVPEPAAPAEPDGAASPPVDAPDVAPSPVAPAPAAPAAPAPPAPAAPDASAATTGGMNAQSIEVLRLVNVQRVQAGCAELRADAQLAAAAQLHSEDMAANGYMSHTSKDGRSAADRATAQGYTAFSGENVAKGYRSAAAVMDGWMGSPGHRANILSCSSVAVGIGFSGDAWTQVFGYA